MLRTTWEKTTNPYVRTWQIFFDDGFYVLYTSPRTCLIVGRGVDTSVQLLPQDQHPPQVASAASKRLDLSATHYGMVVFRTARAPAVSIDRADPGLSRRRLYFDDPRAPRRSPPPVGHPNGQANSIRRIRQGTRVFVRCSNLGRLRVSPPPSRPVSFRY